MPYTAAQLASFFTIDNGGQGPDSTTNLLLAAYAQQDASGTITDAQAIHLTLQYASPTTPGYNTPSSTMDVALSTYEFASGSIPTQAGINYLLTNTGTGLETAYYAGFNQEARYENMMINLAMAPASAYSAAFAATYGAQTFAQAVVTAYNKIIGAANVSAAQATAGETDITSRQAFFQALAAQNPNQNQALATDAAMVGYVLNEAVKADVGTYAVAMDNFNFNLVTGGPTNYGTDITTTYPSTSPYNQSGIIGVSGASGTINFANYPSGTGIAFTSNAVGAVTIINATSTFTLNEATFDNGQAVTVNQAGTGVADTINLTATVAGGAQTINGFETVNYSSAAASTIANTVVTASAGGSETVNISGAGNITFTGLTLVGAGTAINDTASGTLTLNAVSAAAINAGSSGGLIMTAPDALVAGVTGDTITGATLKANVLYGSIGNDVITAGTLGGDKIVTAGGGDTINLGLTHLSDTIYLGSFAGAVPVATGAGVITSGTDVAQAGYFGNAPGATTNLAAAAVSGTSTDQSTVSNFKVGVAGDIITVSKQEWGVGATSAGLTNTDGATPATAGNAVIAIAVAGSTLTAGSDFVELTGQTFANAAAVATALKSTFALTLSSSIAANDGAHILVGYQDASGNAHIADVDFFNTTGAATAVSTSMTEHASDMVQLTGVALASLVSANLVFAA